MNPTTDNAPGPSSTRRWPRFQVKLPVSIAASDDASTISGLVTEISQRGMALYGGVHLETGDLMEIEFPAPSRLRIAGVVRNRTGYCFGLEFLGLLDEEWKAAAPAAPPLSATSGFTRGEVVPAEENLVALVQYRHQAYLKDKAHEIERLRQKALKLQQLRRELESVLRSKSLPRR